MARVKSFVVALFFVTVFIITMNQMANVMCAVAYDAYPPDVCNSVLGKEPKP